MDLCLLRNNVLLPMKILFTIILSGSEDTSSSTALVITF